MSLVLTRVDDRLIHGQVVEGWLPVIQAQRIVVASDRAAADPFQKGLMRLAVPETVAVDILSVAEAAAALKEGRWAEERVLLLLPGVRELAAAVRAGAPVSQVNLGGLHDAPGRTLWAAHIALTAEERTLLDGLERGGLAFDTRALPGDPPRALSDLAPESAGD